ncbi:DUF6221 family protein [Streptomyces sp. NPDC058603]|uniref:DUF6221 family protein n=1 Tax=Streptomyces sp. NPDC058603 TaxID=3346551 RepID=UPI00365A8732
MDDLVAFLRARYDEDAALATEAEQEATGRWMARETDWNDDTFVEDSDGSQILPTVRTRGVTQYQHIARHDPARVLAEVEAKRQITDEHVTRDWKLGDRLHDCQWTKWPCRTLRLLALPYADHDDYREEWRP